MRIEWGENIKKVSFVEFCKQMKDIYKDVPSDERDEKMKALYLEATGRSPEPAKKEPSKKEETE
jgi:hypothetical protein